MTPDPAFGREIERLAAHRPGHTASRIELMTSFCIPVWDRMSGTYKDTTEFVDRCGFPKGAEEKLMPMLAFKDFYFVVPSAVGKKYLVLQVLEGA